MVDDRRKLRYRYFRSWSFKVDILSILPTDLAYIGLGTDCYRTIPCPVIVRINRIARFYQFRKNFHCVETRTNFPYFLRICKLILYILVIIHWNACLFFALNYTSGFSSNQILFNNVTGAEAVSLSYQYIYSFYWSTMVLTTVGNVPEPESEYEYLFLIVDFLIGVLIFAAIVGNIGSMIMNTMAERMQFQQNVDSVKRYMSLRRVPHHIQKKVMKWFDHLWENQRTLNERKTLSVLPDKMKREISIAVHMTALKHVSQFRKYIDRKIL